MWRVFLLFLLFLNFLFSGTLLIGEKESYSLLPLYEYSDDVSESNVSFWSQEHQWKHKKSALDTLSYQPYWIHVRVKNSGRIAKEYFLISERGYVFSLDYYLVKNSKLLIHDSDDFFSASDASFGQSTHRLFPLSIDINETLDLYFKVENCNRVDIPFKLVSYKYLSKYNLYYHFFQGLFFATILIMALYNIIIYFITKHKPYRYYVAYSLLLIIYQGSYFGYFHLLTNLSVPFIYSAMIVSSIGFIIALVYFLRELFSFEEQLERLFSFLVVLLLIGMFGILLGYWLHLHYYVELFFNLINLTMPIYVALVLFSLYSLFFQTRNYLVLWYAIGWSMVACFGLLLILTHLGLISTQYGIEYFFEIAMMVESLLLAIFLAYRIKEIEQEKQTQKILLLRQNRLASMGEMVNMIAHQWRQPLAEINGVVMNLDLDYRTQELNDQSFELYLNEIEGITCYLSKTISDFMNFFNTKKELEEFKLSDLFDELNGILLKRLSEVELLAVFDRDLLIKSYHNELLQVLLIIINNAIDACLLHQSSFAKVIMDAQEKDDYIIISIENNGGTIEKAILDKIFDPYFSTKHQSQGTGLGLYILKIIVEQSMGGKVSILNKGDGVVVLLTLHK